MTGEIYNQVQIDGIYLPYGWCLLVALAQGKVIAWQWCDKENKNAYHALFPGLLTLLWWLRMGMLQH